MDFYVPTIKEAFEKTRNLKQAAVCPHCGLPASFHPIGSFEAERPHRGKMISSIQAAACFNCDCIVLGATLHAANEAKGISSSAELLWPIQVMPDRAPANVDPDAKSTYDEARLIVGLSPRAAAVLARRAIQRLLRKEMGIPEATLFDEIQEALKDDRLCKVTRSAIDHVRKFGNWGAHPSKNKNDPADTLIEVTPEQARYTIQVVELLFRDLYELPAQVAEMEKQVKP